MMDDSKQIWACDECRSQRQWGSGTPDPEMTARPLLNCKPCGKPTPHHFVRLEIE